MRVLSIHTGLVSVLDATPADAAAATCTSGASSPATRAAAALTVAYAQK